MNVVTLLFPEAVVAALVIVAVAVVVVGLRIIIIS
jgi:hypothetical protein